MKTLAKSLNAGIALTILTALLSANSYARGDRTQTNTNEQAERGSVARALPEKSYACQVGAKNGLQGLVMVQTDNRQMAFETASNSMARTLNGRQSPTIAVVQCIEHPKGRFADSTFQKFVENTPL